MAGSTAGRQMDWKTNKSIGKGEKLFVLYPCTLYLVLNIFMVTIAVCDWLRAVSSLNQPIVLRSAHII